MHTDCLQMLVEENWPIGYERIRLKGPEQYTLNCRGLAVDVTPYLDIWQLI